MYFRLLLTCLALDMKHYTDYILGDLGKKIKVVKIITVTIVIKTTDNFCMVSRYYRIAGNFC